MFGMTDEDLQTAANAATPKGIAAGQVFLISESKYELINALLPEGKTIGWQGDDGSHRFAVGMIERFMVSGVDIVGILFSVTGHADPANWIATLMPDIEDTLQLYQFHGQRVLNKFYTRAEIINSADDLQARHVVEKGANVISMLSQGTLSSARAELLSLTPDPDAVSPNYLDAVEIAATLADLEAELTLLGISFS